MRAAEWRYYNNQLLTGRQVVDEGGDGRLAFAGSAYQIRPIIQAFSPGESDLQDAIAILSQAKKQHGQYQ